MSPGRVCSHCTNKMKENRKCNKDIILHINNKCVETPSKGWLEYCLGIFTKKKEDNSDNVTIIIFVAKTGTHFTICAPYHDKGRNSENRKFSHLFLFVLPNIFSHRIVAKSTTLRENKRWILLSCANLKFM